MIKRREDNIKARNPETWKRFSFQSIW
jgi:hypothetical protein